MAEEGAHADEVNIDYSCLFVNPVGQRRADFQSACAGVFAQLRVASGADQARSLLAREPADLVVLDLERCELGIDLAALGALVAERAGKPTLVLCPFTNARWLPALMAFGPIDYAIGPLRAQQTRALLDARLRAGFARPWAPGAAEQELQVLLALRGASQQALGDADDSVRFAERLCAAVMDWPGLAHAALFQHRDGDLHLEAEQGVAGLHLMALLEVEGRLLQSPLRHAFPGLLAAASGEFTLLDAPEKAGEPELAASLERFGVRMVVGVPIPGQGPGGPRGSLCLMFDHARAFSRAQLQALDDLAQLASHGQRMAEVTRENEVLLARVTHLATTDALTEVANRRHGEHLLEQEIKRARRYRLPLALVSFDIDRFSQVNDSFGHPVGDIVLRTVASTVRALLRASDVLVRSGGEEFLVIAPHTSAIDGLRMAEKLRAAIEQVEIPGCDHVTISLGVAQLGESESGDSLAVRANAALARAKRAGRNCVELAMS
ncbi:GGDEF domain-containing protein [Massilia sp. CFBP9012]|uniref:GGDEF domain-containing protein n=1 Tax=Massilia sp. CFBP9012 TaxID=3096531 RepID=UPI002A6B6411|nr:GGDEF domain-containing protein [Massilia sp. CFBP9012]MDY0977182.1 GGDEF domain-containing protein [Massilia sp. CFBP9012]